MLSCVIVVCKNILADGSLYFIMVSIPLFIVPDHFLSVLFPALLVVFQYGSCLFMQVYLC